MNTSGECAVVIGEVDHERTTNIKMGLDFEGKYIELSKKKLFWNLEDYYNAPIPDNPNVVVTICYQNIYKSIKIGHLMGVDKGRLKRNEVADLKYLSELLNLIRVQLEKSNDPIAKEVAGDLKRLVEEYKSL